MGVFAATLTGLWPVLVDFAPILNFVFHDGCSFSMVSHIHVLDCSKGY